MKNLKHKKLFFWFFASALSFFAMGNTPPSQAKTPTVLVATRPLCGIAAHIMKGVGTPELLVKGNVSPHLYRLTPRDALLIQKADLILWVGPSYEGFLAKSLKSLPQTTAVITADDLPGIKTLDYRTPHHHGEHKHHSHDHEDSHAHHGHEHDDHLDDHHHSHAHEHSHEDHHHAHDGIDGHLWLSPDNALVIAKQLAHHLCEKDPEHATQYRENLSQFQAKIPPMVQKIRELLKDLNPTFFVFHDAYQYFENFFGVKSLGAVLLDPELPMGDVFHIQKIQQFLNTHPGACVFREPEFSDALAQKIVNGTTGRVEELDPLGQKLPLDEAFYPTLLEQIASRIASCGQGLKK